MSYNKFQPKKKATEIITGKITKIQRKGPRSLIKGMPECYEFYITVGKTIYFIDTPNKTPPQDIEKGDNIEFKIEKGVMVSKYPLIIAGSLGKKISIKEYEKQLRIKEEKEG